MKEIVIGSQVKINAGLCIIDSKISEDLYLVRAKYSFYSFTIEYKDLVYWIK